MPATGYAGDLVADTKLGLSNVVGISILLIGAGTISGILTVSAFETDSLL